MKPARCRAAVRGRAVQEGRQVPKNATRAARRYALSTAAAAALLATAPARAQDLVFDPANGNTPYAPIANAGYADVVVGNTGAGQIDPAAYDLSASATVSVGNASSGSGTYNFSGSAALILNGSNATAYVGYAGTGLVDQAGTSGVNLGSNTLDLGYAPTASGAYALGDGSGTDAPTLAAGTFWMADARMAAA